MSCKKNINAEIHFPGGSIEIEDVAAKFLGLFGEDAEEVGRQIDEATKDTTIHLFDWWRGA